MIIFGILLQLIGFLLCFTIIGAVLGIPLIFIGGFMIIFGFFGRRKTIIQNVVTVQNTTPATPDQTSRPPVYKAARADIGELSAPDTSPQTQQLTDRANGGVRVPDGDM